MKNPVNLAREEPQTPRSGVLRYITGPHSILGMEMNEFCCCSGITEMVLKVALKKTH